MQQEQSELLQALYEGYQGALRFVAYNSGIPYDEIDDIVQDTFCAYIRAYEKKLPEWNEAQRKSVLMRILKNRCSDYFRAKKRFVNVSIDTGNFGEELQIPDQFVTKDVLDYVTDREDLRIIRESIKTMRPAWRDVAILHFVEGRPIAEVCEILKINNPTCRMRISRIRKYLREQVGNAPQRDHDS